MVFNALNHNDKHEKYAGETFKNNLKKIAFCIYGMYKKLIFKQITQSYKKKSHSVYTVWTKN